MREGLAALQAAGTLLREPYYLCLLAEGYGRAGRYEEGLAALSEAQAVMERTGEYWMAAELLRCRGELLSNNGAVREAEVCLRRAVEEAHRQEARSPALRAVLSLGKLLHRQDRSLETRQALESLRAWLSEGSSTVDVKAVDELLRAWG